MATVTAKLPALTKTGPLALQITLQRARSLATGSSARKAFLRLPAMICTIPRYMYSQSQAWNAEIMTSASSSGSSMSSISGSSMSSSSTSSSGSSSSLSRSCSVCSTSSSGSSSGSSRSCSF